MASNLPALSSASPVDASPLVGKPTEYPPAELPRIQADASWPLFPDFAGVVQEADVFVVGQVVDVRPGRRVGDPSLPFTNVDLLVIEIGKGGPFTGSIITIEQTGGVYEPTHAANDAKGSIAPLPSDAPGGARPYPAPPVVGPVILELRDDPILRPGERVALALVWKGDLGLYQLVNPQGRFSIDLEELVHPIRSADPAVRDLDGLPVERLLVQVRTLAATR